MLATQKYVLRFTVLNPPYAATKNFLLSVDEVGTVKDMANVVTSLTTNPIALTSD